MGPPPPYPTYSLTAPPPTKTGQHHGPQCHPLVCTYRPAGSPMAATEPPAQRGRSTYLSKTKRAKAVLCPCMRADSTYSSSALSSARGFFLVADGAVLGPSLSTRWCCIRRIAVVRDTQGVLISSPGSRTLGLTGITVNTDSPSLAASLSSRDSATRPAEPLQGTEHLMTVLNHCPVLPETPQLA